VQAQAFQGLYATDNSITQVRDNPVFAIHDDRAQFNFLGIGFEAGGNTLLFRKKALNYLFTGNAAMNEEYERNNNSGKNKQFWGNFEVMGPGASFIVKRRYYFSFTTGMRYMVNSDNLSSGVADLLGVNGTKDTAAYRPYTVDNYSLTASAFSEYNLTYAGFFMESEVHTIEGGVTFKLLNGAGAAGVGIPRATFNTSNADGHFYNVRAIANVAFTPYANDWAITANPFNPFRHPMNNLGFGLSAGAVYYYNPREGMVPKKGYKARVAVSITDIGSINYEAASTTGTYRLTDSAINYKNITNNTKASFGNQIYNDYIVTGQATGLSGGQKRFKVYLPTALHVNVDYKFSSRIYMNANMLINLRKPSPDYYSTHYVSTLTLTPKYKFGRVNLAVPVCLNAAFQAYAGAVVEVGSFYAGSASLLRYATSNSLNNINLFMGANFRLQHHRQTEKEEMMQ